MLVTQRVLVLVDHDNLEITCRDKFHRRVDYDALVSYLADGAEGRQLLECAIYLGLPPAMPDYAETRGRKERYAAKLRRDGWMAVTKEGTPKDPAKKTFKANVDTLMAMDAVELSLDMHPDVVVLVTGDSDFAPLAARLRRRGIRVEVTSVADSLSRQLAEAANGVIDLAGIVDRFPSANGQAAAPVGTTAVLD